MGYLHINNLYKDQTVLQFRYGYALEKIHGTSADIEYDPATDIIKYFAGGESHERFVKLFNDAELKVAFKNLNLPIDKKITVYGEAYGGKQQGMSDTYGKELKFICFDVQIGECWLDVEKAAALVQSLKLEFVPYEKVEFLTVGDYGTIITNIKELDRLRDQPSRQAKRNGIVEDKKSEGIVLRPIIEVTLNNGSRVICKHKTDEFRETASPRVVDDPVKLQVIADAELVADEWVTLERLKHVLDKIPDYGMDKIPVIMNAMLEDVLREGKGELVESEAVSKAIKKKAVDMFKTFIKNKLATTK